MFRKGIIGTLVGIFALLVSSCGKEEEIKNITKKIVLDKESVSLLVGQKERVLIQEGNGDYKITSNNPSVAQVTLTENALEIEAKSQGEAKITITDKQAQSAELTLAVWESIALEKKELFLAKNATAVVAILAGGGQYQIKNDNESAVQAILEGKNISINAVGVGEANISVADVNTQKMEHFKVSVSELTTDKTQQAPLQIGTQVVVNITSGSGSYTATSDNENIATAQLEGTAVRIVAKNAGEAKVTIRDEKTGELVGIVLSVQAAELKLSVGAVVVKNKQTATLEILQGSGNYSLEMKNNEIATATLNNNIITIEPQKQGAATTLKVTDNATGKHQEVSIGVPYDYYDTESFDMRNRPIETQEYGTDAIGLFGGNPTVVVKDPSIVKAQIIVDEWGEVVLQAIGVKQGETTIEVSQGDKKMSLPVKVSKMPDFSLERKDYQFSYEGENIAGNIQGSTQYQYRVEGAEKDVLEIEIREGTLSITLNKKVSGAEIKVIIKDIIQQKEEVFTLRVK